MQEGLTFTFILYYHMIMMIHIYNESLSLVKTTDIVTTNTKINYDKRNK